MNSDVSLYHIEGGRIEKSRDTPSFFGFLVIFGDEKLLRESIMVGVLENLSNTKKIICEIPQPYTFFAVFYLLVTSYTFKPFTISTPTLHLLGGYGSNIGVYC